MTNANISNASDYIRQLIIAECERQGISVDKEELHHTVSNRNERSELVRIIKEIRLEIAKLKDKNALLEKQNEQQLNGVNAILNYYDVTETYLENETEKDKVKPNPIIVKSGINYENKMRRLAIEKQNKGKQENR